MPDAITVPRLSTSFTYVDYDHCSRCGLAFTVSFVGGEPGLFDDAVATLHTRTVWREHDDDDRPEMIFSVLCRMCADRVIEPHARLYAELGKSEPAPGVMRICFGCRHQVAYRCTSPQARANGGEGLVFPAADSTIHIDYTDSRGRRRGKWLREWKEEAATCGGFERKD